MVKKRVFLFGDLPLASQILKLFLKHPQAEVIGVHCEKPERVFENDPFEEKDNLYETAKKCGVRVFLDLEETKAFLKEHGADLGLSCRASTIFKSDIIRCFRDYFLNLHGGLLPERRGLNIACHCILEGDREGGGTLHILNEGIDTGAVIDRGTFPIEATDTAFDVYQKTQIALLEVVRRNMDGMLSVGLKPIPQEELIRDGETPKYFNRNAVSEVKEISLSTATKETIDRIVRACDFPGHEPAYTVINGRKIYLTTREFFKGE